MKDRTQKILRGLLYCSLLGGFVVAFSISALWLKMLRDDRLAHVEIQKRLEAIRAAGQPLTAQDLAKFYPDPPPEHDAVLMLKPALSALVVPEDTTNLPFFNENGPRGTTPLEKPVLAEMARWIGKNQKAFDSVSLEQLNGSWIGCSFTNGFTNLVYAPVSKINSLTKLLCLNAVLQAEFQHPKEAIQSLEKAAAVGNAWRNDLPIHGMSKLATQDRVCWTLNRVLNRTPIAEADLADVSNLLTITNLGVIKQNIIFDRCVGVSHADQLQSLARQTTVYSISPVRLFLNSCRTRIIYRDQDLLNLLDWDGHSLAATDLPLSNAVPALAELERHRDNLAKTEIKLLNKYLLNTFKKDRFSFLVVDESASHQRLLSEASLVAQVRATRTAIAVERWRLAHNSDLPDSLAQLVPDFLPLVPPDPFDGQPLRYKKLARGYVVYSVGPDFTDDGGKEKPANASDSAHYDITFTVER
jgi:hypothetical protein